MIAIDIGNTNIVIATFFNKKIIKIIRMGTEDKDIKKKLDYNFTSKKNLKLDYNFCVISSVSSHSNKKIINFFKKLKYKILNINLNNIPKEIKFNYVNKQLGADRIANTFAAINKYGRNSIVIDFGTATTFDLVVNNIYLGGLIAPGINISHDALVKKASKLKKISIKKTKKTFGNDTKSSMQAGFYWGYVSLVNGIINKIILDEKIKPKIILTGGLACIFKEEIKYTTFHEPNLTLEGLYLIGKKKHA